MLKNCIKMASLSRFKGSLVGAVVGDCIGAIYECEGSVNLKQLLKTIDDIETDYREKSVNTLKFTDDTAMARSVAASLIKHKGLNIKDMAKRFADEFHKEPNRGYGGSVSAVFEALYGKDLEDVFAPARKQFDGEGSFGNGAAMRIAPLALFTFQDNHDTLKQHAEKISRLTHSHLQAIQGAVLQSSAVDLALRADPSVELDREKFLDQLIDRMKPMEEEAAENKSQDVTKSPTPKRKPKRKSDTEDNPYCYKLEKMKEFLKEDVSVETIEDVLGNDISALGSAPAAVYSFLRSYTEIPNIPRESAFERTVIYAISLGGDTDTIATMAGAIAGAYYGLESVPESWRGTCEGVDDAKLYAEELWELFQQRSK